jgi:hypothetical protein
MRFSQLKWRPLADGKRYAVTHKGELWATIFWQPGSTFNIYVSRDDQVIRFEFDVGPEVVQSILSAYFFDQPRIGT